KRRRRIAPKRPRLPFCTSPKLYAITVVPWLSTPPARIQFIPLRRSDEEPVPDARAGCRRAAAARPGGPAAGRPRPAVHHGVLLQGAMGPSAGVSAALPEEPLSAAAENG